MELFFVEKISKQVKLTPEESKHIIKVLRHKQNDIIFLTDGQGKLYEAKIIEDNPKQVIAQIVKVRNDFGLLPFKISIALPPLKIPSRYEWFIEKATELGVDTIYPVITRFTEVRKVKQDRIRKLIIAALKQSLRTQLPKFEQIIDLEEFFDMYEIEDYEQKLIAVCDAEKALSEVYKPNLDTIVLIGPEGGFSQEEIKMAIDSDFIPVKLGYTRLRAETAAITALSTMVNLNLKNKANE